MKIKLFLLSVFVHAVTAHAGQVKAAGKGGEILRRGPGVIDVRDYGASGNGKTINTQAIQKAIDDCSASGGGKVLFANGNYVTGTIFIKNNVILYIEAGAILSGSTNIADYSPAVFRNQYAGEPHMDRCLIFAENAHNIGIEGTGTINGNGEKSNFPNAGDPNHYRPMLIRLLKCENITLKDVKLLNPAAWTNAIIYCKRINVDGITVSSRVNDNGDGLDFDGCQDVTVNNCVFDNSDDSICLQASDKEYPCRNITVSNCIMTSKCAAIRIGLLSIGDFYNVTVDNCIFHGVTDAGLKIQMNEGGRMENFIFSNLVMKEVTRAILMTYNNFTVYVGGPEKPAPMQAMKNFMFTNIRLETKTIRPDDIKPLVLITGLEGHNIENITLSNFHLTGPGGGTASDGTIRSIPELDNIRPEFFQFGKVVPAYGIYVRHVKGLIMDNLLIDTETPDHRPAIICDDVENVELSDSRAALARDAECMIRLQNVRYAWIRGSRSLNPGKTFLQVEGKQSRDILLTGNDLRFVKQPFTCEKGATSQMVELRR